MLKKKKMMQNLKRRSCSLLLAGAFIATAFIGCAARVGVGYRAYDPYYHDYHAWDDHETVFYNQWAVETHRDPHRDYRKLKHNEQKEYWDWRHKKDKH